MADNDFQLTVRPPAKAPKDWRTPGRFARFASRRSTRRGLNIRSSRRRLLGPVSFTQVGCNLMKTSNKSIVRLGPWRVLRRQRMSDHLALEREFVAMRSEPASPTLMDRELGRAESRGVAYRHALQPIT